MSLDKNEVEQIAHLARLQLSADEVEKVADSVSDILSLIDQMQSVNTDEVEPLAHPFDAIQRLRADVVNETDQREYFQVQAPNSQDGLYLVPKVIE